MNLQEAFDKARNGVVKDAEKVWVESGYTAPDFDYLKYDMREAIDCHERKAEKFNDT